jgi:hypothetical protein
MELIKSKVCFEARVQEFEGCFEQEEARARGLN